MNPADLPLLQLFNDLVDAGLVLGIEEYEAVLHALQRGFGRTNAEALARLCKLLWTTSLEQERIFDYHFAIFLKRLQTAYRLSDTSQQLKPEQAVEKKTFVPSEPTTNESPTPVASPMTQAASTDSSASTGDFWQFSNLFAQVEDSPQIKFTLRNQPATTDQKKRKTTEKPQSSMQLSLETEEDTRITPPLPLYGEDVDETKRIQSKYSMSERYYLPVNRRQLKQSWRTLRWPLRQGPPIELDVDRTVEEIGRTGIFLAPVLQPRRVNQAHLLLLLDHEGSMVPFGALSRRLAYTAIRGGHLSRADIFYFHDCPRQYIFSDQRHQEALELTKLENFATSHTAALIFSDAGAARNHFSQDRLDETIAFLQILKEQIPYVAWLNPLPFFRWFGNTAQYISQHVPMFPTSQRGVSDAIRVLRGRQVN